MTTADQLGFRGWRTSAEVEAAVGADDGYVGKHRRPGAPGRSLRNSVRGILYMGRHRTH